MNIIVIGPQHSCTRLVVGLIDRHQDVKHVDHMGTNDLPELNNKLWNEKIYDKLVFVSRDASCINKSNEENNNIPFEEGIAEKTINRINININHIIDNNIYNFNDIIFISIESLVQFKELVIKKLLTQIGLDHSTYDFNLIGNYTPNDINNSKKRWFNINLNIVDPNKKYFK